MLKTHLGWGQRVCKTNKAQISPCICIFTLTKGMCCVCLCSCICIYLLAFLYISVNVQHNFCSFCCQLSVQFRKKNKPKTQINWFLNDSQTCLMCDVYVTHGITFALLQLLWAAPFEPDAKWHKGSLTADTRCGPAIFYYI